MLPIYSRTPVATAQQAATIDEYSDGRMVLGLGVSHQVTVENWYGAKLERAAAGDARVRRHRARRASAARTRRRARSSGRHFHFMGFEPRADLPIYVAALSPKMLRLAGEIADGVMLWLCNPEYIRDVVVPEVRAGRERAGKSLEGFDIVAAVPAAVTDDRDGGLRDDARRPGHLLEPALLPRDDRALGLRATTSRPSTPAWQAGDVERAKAGISDGFLEALTAIGSPEDVRAGRRRATRRPAPRRPASAAVPAHRLRRRRWRPRRPAAS